MFRRIRLLFLMLRVAMQMASVPRQAHTIASKHNDLARRVHALENGSMLEGGATISKGGLTAKDPNTSNTTTFMGLGGFSDGSGRKQMINAMYRADGTLALIIADLGTAPGHTFQQALQIWDHGGDIVFADDITAGQGLARPYIPLGTFVDALVPTATTTSTSFVTLQTLSGYKQHPKVVFQVLVYADSGTTGTIQIIDQSSNVVATTNLTSGQFGYVNFGPTAIVGTHELPISLNIQGKVLTGAGKVGARGTYAIGIQS